MTEIQDPTAYREACESRITRLRGEREQAVQERSDLQAKADAMNHVIARIDEQIKTLGEEIQKCDSALGAV